MVDIQPYDDVEERDCRWKIEGVGLVFGDEIEETLVEFYRAVEFERERETEND